MDIFLTSAPAGSCRGPVRLDEPPAHYSTSPLEEPCEAGSAPAPAPFRPKRCGCMPTWTSCSGHWSERAHQFAVTGIWQRSGPVLLPALRASGSPTRSGAGSRLRAVESADAISVARSVTPVRQAHRARGIWADRAWSTNVRAEAASKGERSSASANAKSFGEQHAVARARFEGEGVVLRPDIRPRRTTPQVRRSSTSIRRLWKSHGCDPFSLIESSLALEHGVARSASFVRLP